MGRAQLLYLAAIVWLPLLGAAPAQGGGAKGPWKLAANDFAHYRLDVESYGDERSPDGTLFDPLRSACGVFGYELVGGERPRRPMHEEEWIVLAYALWMPRSLVRVGASLRISDTFNTFGEQHATLRGRGKVSVAGVRKSTAAHEVDLTGLVRFTSRPGETDGRDALPRGAGVMHWRATFDVTKGLMKRASFGLSLDRARALSDPHGKGHVKANRLHFDGTLTLRRTYTHRYDGFKRDVGSAIERAKKALMAKRDPQGVWAARSHDPVGETALNLLALIKGGAARDDRRLQGVVDWLVSNPPRCTYAAGIVLAALEAWRAPAKELGFGEGKASGVHGSRKLTKAERGLASKVTTFLLDGALTSDADAPRGRHTAPRVPGGAKRGAVTGSTGYMCWGYPGPHQLRAARPPRADRDAREYWDNSNSQYAVLGLHSAALCEIRVPRYVWPKVAGHFLRHQRADGPAWRAFKLGAGADGGRYALSRRAKVARVRGWSYGYMDGDEEDERTSAYGSMTCAGISSLAIADGAMMRARTPGYARGRRSAVLQAIRDGFAFLDKHWSSWANPARGRYYYLYYLYSLERAAMLSGVTWIGSHDWYWEGALQLLLSQDEQGSWRASTGGNAFALLFLKRGTTAVVTGR